MDLVLSDLSIKERYKFLTAVVTPRPIAFVTTRNLEGVLNAAPFSFFNVFSEEPPVVILGLNNRPDDRKKDTLVNIQKTGEFVINMVDYRVVEAMHICSADFPYGESEIDCAGVGIARSLTIETPRIAESPASLECKLSSVIELNERRNLVLGCVLCIHLLDEIVDAETRRIIPEQYSPLARLYGDNYAWLGKRYARAIPSYQTAKASRNFVRIDEAAESDTPFGGLTDP